jgi:3-isopropylmalate/(R)-2-methylmalate dehydratase small subunit
MAAKVYRVGDDIDTDVILPGRYLNLTDPAELAKHCMEAVDPNFSSKIKAGDIIVAGRNFGCGSSRENAPIAIKGAGISAVIAESFARIFYRNSINIGLPIFECREAAQSAAAGDEFEIDPAAGIIANKTKNKTFQLRPMPGFLQRLCAEGGLLPYIKAQNKKKEEALQ